MLVISGIFLFTSRDIGYLGNLFKGIFSDLLKGICMRGPRNFRQGGSKSI